MKKVAFILLFWLVFFSFGQASQASEETEDFRTIFNLMGEIDLDDKNISIAQELKKRGATEKEIFSAAAIFVKKMNYKKTGQDLDIIAVDKLTRKEMKSLDPILYNSYMIFLGELTGKLCAENQESVKNNQDMVRDCQEVKRINHQINREYLKLIFPREIKTIESIMKRHLEFQDGKTLI